jgi:hypothetical protein
MAEALLGVERLLVDGLEAGGVMATAAEGSDVSERLEAGADAKHLDERRQNVTVGGSGPDGNLDVLEEGAEGGPLTNHMVDVKGNKGLGLDALFETAKDTLAYRVIVDEDSIGNEALKKRRYTQQVGAVLRGLSGQERVKIG